MKVYVLIGAPGVGKSTWSNKQENAVILSSDKIRKELYNTNDLQEVQDNNHHTQVFDVLHKRLMQLVKEDKQDVIYDATNTNRKRRTHLYNEIKRVNETAEVVAVLFLKPLATILEQNKNREHVVPEKDVKKKYVNLVIPKIGLDCDRIERAYGRNFEEFEKEFEGDIAHDTPYHLETVREHINSTIENAETEELKEVAKYHDLGKFITKEVIQNGIARYKNHEVVSAMYYLADLEELTQEKLDLAEVILYHMLAHGKISQKTINRYNLTNRQLELLEQFAVIDDKSRIVDVEFFKNKEKENN